MGFVAQLAPGRVWRGLRTKRHKRRILVAWMSFAAVELILTASDLRPVALLPGMLEFAGLTALGLVHAALAPDDWRGSSAWPGVIGTSAILWRLSAEIVRLSFDVLTPMMPFAGLGLCVVVYLVVRLLDRAVWRRIPAASLSIVLPLALRLLFLGTDQVAQPLLPQPAPTADGPPIVIITVDTLRSDAAMQMESVRLLAERGAVWPRATAPSSWTWPSIVTLWSGVAAETHGSGRAGEVRYKINRWSDDLPWLPRALGQAGYVRAAFVTNPVIRMMRLASSFDHYVHGGVVAIPLALTGYVGQSADGGDARKVVDAALDWLDDAPARGFLLWVHLLEPHVPYRHATERPYDFNDLRKVKMGDWFMTEDERLAVKDAYLEEVAYADGQIVRLIRALEKRGHFDDGVVVLSSDHGEEFWEHEGFEHGHSHHGEVIDVPLVLVAPGVEPGARDDVAALQDVAPTLRAVAGLATDGVDLRRPIPEDRVAHVFGNLYFRNMRSARVGSTRVIVDGDEIASYDLLRDPQEQNPRIISATELQVLTGPRPEAAGGSDVGSVDFEKQALRALGYVH